MQTDTQTHSYTNTHTSVQVGRKVHAFQEGGGALGESRYLIYTDFPYFDHESLCTK